MIGFGLSQCAEPFRILTLNPFEWLGMAYVVVPGTVVAFTFWYRGIKQTGPVKTTLYHYLVSVVSMVIGPFLTGEKVTAGQVAEGALVLAGLIIARAAPRPLRGNRISGS